MAFDNPDFGRKNYEEYLHAARETLEVKYLTAGDWSIIERGIYYLVRGDDLLKREDPESLREAAWLFLAGGYYLGECCAVSDSEARYWEIKKRGGPKRRPGKRSKETQAWRNYISSNLPEAVQSNPDFKPKELAEEFILDGSAPKSLPKDVEYLARFIRNELKVLKATGKKAALQLVRSG